MQLKFPVSDVRPAWIDGSAGARPAHSNLPALYNSRSHPPFVSILISFSSSLPFCLAVVICHSLHLSAVSVTTKATQPSGCSCQGGTAFYCLIHSGEMSLNVTLKVQGVFTDIQGGELSHLLSVGE